MTKGLRSSLGLCLAVGWLALSFLSLAASPAPINVYLFSAKGCYHCLEAKKFLVKLKEKHPHIKVVELEITASRENQEIFRQVAAQLQVDLAGAPCIFIGATPIVGWQGETATGVAIDRASRRPGSASRVTSSPRFSRLKSICRSPAPTPRFPNA